ncbi:MAG TPA: ABC transporter permease [Thermoanaerobaculia bacterium]|nr:ABC transporter permease [Thermoanaerobaculia bacterium]
MRPDGVAGAGSALPLYDSSGRPPRVIEEARALWAYRNLVVEMAIRDIKIRYKRSVLGVFWTMLAPLLNMVALTLVFSALLKAQIRSYPVYYLAGSLFWTFFSQTTSNAASQTRDANEMAKRIYIPRSVFVASAVAVGLVNLALATVPMLLLLLVMRFPLHATWLFLPVGVLLLSLFSAGVSLVLFTVASRFSDVREMYLVFVQTWFFLTPIVYHPSIIPARFRLVLWLNPMYYLIQTFRRPIYDGLLPEPRFLIPAIAISLTALICGWIYFCRHADQYAFES